MSGPASASPGTSALPSPRAELGLHPGYHSPQVAARVRLNTNESPYPPPPGWLQAVLEQARDMTFNRYPDRQAVALRQALADFHAVPLSQVFAANGSNEVLQALCLAYGGPGRRAVVFEPTYALHSHIPHLTSTEVVTGQRDEDFALGPALALSMVQNANPSLVFLCSPNNPTGRAEEPATVGALTGAFDGLVVVDEAYGQFASWSALSMVGDDKPLVVVRTFSKTWSMAGLRLGYLVGPSAVVEALERVALPYHLDMFKQAAGRLALKYSDQMGERVASIVEERQKMSRDLSALGVKVWPSQANFVLWQPLAKPGAQVWEALMSRGVMVRDMSSWPSLNGCLRTTVGTPDENKIFLDALKEVMA